MQRSRGYRFTRPSTKTNAAMPNFWAWEFRADSISLSPEPFSGLCDLCKRAVYDVDSQLCLDTSLNARETNIRSSATITVRELLFWRPKLRCDLGRVYYWRFPHCTASAHRVGKQLHSYLVKIPVNLQPLSNCLYTTRWLTGVSASVFVRKNISSYGRCCLASNCLTILLRKIFV